MNLPMLPHGKLHTYKTVFRQTLPAPANFTAASNSQTFTLFGLPAGYIVTAVRFLLVSKFVAFGLSSCSVILGTTGALNYYAPMFELTQVPSDTTFEWWSPMGMYTTAAQDVIATFTSVGAQLVTLTSGELEITVQHRSL